MIRTIDIGKEKLGLVAFLCFILGYDQLAIQSGWHQKFGWNGSDYFDDPKVVDLCEANERNDTKEMKRLVDQGVNVNATGKGNMTPLLWAFPDNKIDRFKLLLENGGSANVVVEADFNTRQAINPGDSVTILAARTAFPDQLGLLLEYGGKTLAKSCLINLTRK
ncbi:MAG: hypothetical protein SGI77_20740 [Pirellulaceae bacterium]|nr:hypothetical protein [Pirellulaceae bacterium]